jgi:SNF2 family DNA or RNA helicase
MIAFKLMLCQLHQWKAELETHGKFKQVLIYNNTDRDNNQPRRINMNQVVLTTYAQIRKSFPFPDSETMRELGEKAAEEEKSLAEVIQDWVTENKKLAGCLHRIHWYRVSVLLSPVGHANNIPSDYS